MGKPYSFLTYNKIYRVGGIIYLRIFFNLNTVLARNAICVHLMVLQPGKHLVFCLANERSLMRGWGLGLSEVFRQEFYRTKLKW